MSDRTPRTMKPIAIAAMSLAMLFALGAASAAAAPRLELSEMEFDFGYVPQNSAISHVFWLRSTGDDSVSITKVYPGCGCTKAPLERSELAAGDSTRLEIIFSTRRYRNKVIKTPRVQANDSPTPRIIRIISNVITDPKDTYPVLVKPYKLDISQFGSRVHDKTVFELTNVSEEELKLEIIDRPDNYFSLKVPQSIPAGATVQCTLTLTDKGVEGEFEKSFTVQFDDEAKSRFTIPVKRTIKELGAR